MSDEAGRLVFREGLLVQVGGPAWDAVAYCLPACSLVLAVPALLLGHCIVTCRAQAQDALHSHPHAARCRLCARATGLCWMS